MNLAKGARAQQWLQDFGTPSKLILPTVPGTHLEADLVGVVRAGEWKHTEVIQTWLRAEHLPLWEAQARYHALDMSTGILVAWLKDGQALVYAVDNDVYDVRELDREEILSIVNGIARQLGVQDVTE